MKKLILLLLSAFLLSGCFQYKRELILNPDGSGKMTVETEMMKGLSFGAEQDEKETMKTAVANLIKSSEGIEAWTGISYKMTEADMIAFKGTAYFKDVTKIKLYNVNAAGISTEKLPNGDIRITLQRGGNKSKGEQAKKLSKKKKITPENVGEEMTRQRAEYKKSHPLFTAILAMTDNEDTITVFGEVKEYKNIIKLEDGRFRYIFKGEEAIKEIDAFMTNDELLKNAILEEGAVLHLDLSSSNVLKDIGERLGKSVIVYTPKTGRAFDFEQEVAAAKAEARNVAQSLAPEGPKVVELLTGNFEFKATKIVAVTMTNYDQDFKERYNTGTCTEVLVQGLFNGSVLKVDKVELFKAVSEGGENLIPEKSVLSYKQIPTLNNTKDSVEFSIFLKSLPKGSLGIREISGRCRVFTGSGTEFVDLGFKELKEGKAGTALGAKIGAINKSQIISTSKPAVEESNVQIDIKVGPSFVKSWKILDETGKEVKFSDGGAWSTDNTISKTCILEGKVPVKGKILVEVYKDHQAGSASFKFENIKLTDFTGAPELER